MNDEFDVNASDKRAANLKETLTICRYALAAIGVVFCTLSYSCVNVSGPSAECVRAGTDSEYWRGKVEGLEASQ